MASGRECYHCKQWIAAGEPHDCWTTSEAALTRDLSEDLREAWERLRETAVEFGEQRIYASHHSIMFSRRSCYFFVRPRRAYLELCVFLGRPLNAPQVKKVTPTSKTRIAHLLRLRHRDEVEAPITDWLREAYHLQDVPARQPRPADPAGRRTTGTRNAGSRGDTNAPAAAARRAPSRTRVARKKPNGRAGAAGAAGAAAGGNTRTAGTRPLRSSRAGKRTNRRG